MRAQDAAVEPRAGNQHLNGPDALQVLLNSSSLKLPTLEAFPTDEQLACAGMDSGPPCLFFLADDAKAPKGADGPSYFCQRDSTDAAGVKERDVTAALATRLFNARSQSEGGARGVSRTSIREYQLLAKVATRPADAAAALTAPSDPGPSDTGELGIRKNDLVDVEYAMTRVRHFLAVDKVVFAGDAGKDVAAEFSQTRPYGAKRIDVKQIDLLDLRDLDLGQFGLSPNIPLELPNKGKPLPISTVAPRSHWRRAGPRLYSLSPKGDGTTLAKFGLQLQPLPTVSHGSHPLVSSAPGSIAESSAGGDSHAGPAAFAITLQPMTASGSAAALTTTAITPIAQAEGSGASELAVAKAELAAVRAELVARDAALAEQDAENKRLRVEFERLTRKRAMPDEQAPGHS
jgi:hypothetical protein